jgi:crotonobetainyl-CoA:carnitine CoA-transferase CaiB-like acyl-CoA transferase
MPQAPLAGYRVLELAHLIAGPVRGLYLADMGADVVKVEAPGTSLVRDPQVRASGMLTEQDHPRAGRFPTIGIAIRFARTPGTIRTPAPALEEHTDEVPQGIGCTRDESTGSARRA